MLSAPCRWHVNHFYAIYDGAEAAYFDSPNADLPLCATVTVAKIPMTFVDAGIANLETGWLPGLSVVLDHPDTSTAQQPGSWAELLGALTPSSQSTPACARSGSSLPTLGTAP